MSCQGQLAEHHIEHITDGTYLVVEKSWWLFSCFFHKTDFCTISWIQSFTQCRHPLDWISSTCFISRTIGTRRRW
jgi:hypothetical protein